MKTTGAVGIGLAIAAVMFGTIHVLNRISDHIHADAVAEWQVQNPAEPTPMSVATGAWRLEAYGPANCVWVRGHMQSGRWMDGYWRRKPRAAQQIPQ